MATITGFTAERMQEIVDETIVGGRVDGEDLIFIRKDLTEIVIGSFISPSVTGVLEFISVNLGEIDGTPNGFSVANPGSVRMDTDGKLWVKQTGVGNTGWGEVVLTGTTTTSGFGFVVDEDAMTSNSNTKVPTQQSVKAYVDGLVGASGSIIICTSSTRPSTPTIGQTIYETNTGSMLVYYGATTGWHLPWNMPRGIIAFDDLLTNRTMSVGGDVSGVVTPSATFHAGRWYKATVNATIANNIAGVNELIMALHTGASGSTTRLGYFPVLHPVSGMWEGYTGQVMWKQLTTVTQQTHLRAEYLFASMIFFGGDRSPTQLIIEDAGPHTTVPVI